MGIELGHAGPAGGSETLRRMRAGEITPKEYAPELSAEAVMIAAKDAETRRRRQEAAQGSTLLARLRKIGKSVIYR